MPFQSKAQAAKCYAMKAQGGTNWDCDEFSKQTDFKSLPERAKQAVLAHKNRKKKKNVPPVY